MYVIVASVALSVGFLVVALAGLANTQARPSRSRMVELGLESPFSKDAAARRSSTRTRVNEVLTLLGEKVAKPEQDAGAVRQRLIHAGYRERSALPIFFGLRIAVATLLYFYVVFILAALEQPGAFVLFMGLMGAVAGWIVPNFILSTRITKRQKEIQKALPDAVDLLVICVEAGLGLNQALQRVAVEMRHLSKLVTMEVSQMNLEIRAGTPRDQAFLALADRTGVADLRSLATMLIQTERFGTSIADSLRIHAETMRTKRQQRAEEAAAKTTIKMVFPLALCIFPALFVVVLGPALISIIQTFSRLAR